MSVSNSSISCPTGTVSPAIPSGGVMSYSLSIQIQVWGNVGNGSEQVQNIIPSPIGIPHCTWATHQYDAYGVAGRYPIYVLPLVAGSSFQGWSTIYVDSTKNLNYTLGDFFAVWGQTLNNKTMFGKTVPPAPSYRQFNDTWIWSLCVGYGAGPFIPVYDHWSGLILSTAPYILLTYNTNVTGCG
jgi:hypothetical protein